jgi:hypothetical protein
VTRRIRAGLIETEEKAVAMQRLGKHVTAVTNKHAVFV